MTFTYTTTGIDRFYALRRDGETVGEVYLDSRYVEHGTVTMQTIVDALNKAEERE